MFVKVNYPPSTARTKIEFIGLGPMNGVAPSYEASVVAHLDWVVKEFDGLWASRANTKPLEVVVNFSDDSSRARVRVVNRQSRCFTSIHRTPKSTHAPDAVELARQDVIDWLEAVRRRFDLDPWPELAPLATLASDIRAHRVPEDE